MEFKNSNYYGAIIIIIVMFITIYVNLYHRQTISMIRVLRYKTLIFI